MPCYIDHLGLYAETFLQFITNLETMRFSAWTTTTSA